MNATAIVRRVLCGLVQNLLVCRIRHPRAHMQLDPESLGHMCTPMFSISALLVNLQPRTLKGAPVPWEGSLHIKRSCGRHGITHIYNSTDEHGDQTAPR